MATKAKLKEMSMDNEDLLKNILELMTKVSEFERLHVRLSKALRL